MGHWLPSAIGSFLPDGPAFSPSYILSRVVSCLRAGTPSERACGHWYRGLLSLVCNPAPPKSMAAVTRPHSRPLAPFLFTAILVFFSGKDTVKDCDDGGALPITWHALDKLSRR